MPLAQGDEGDTEDRPAGRIRDTRKLLITAAVIMSVFLLTTSVVTTLLISPDAFQSGGPANGRALAFLAHQNPGNGFGTLYDLSTITILWFAGASAMAGLLNLVPIERKSAHQPVMLFVQRSVNCRAERVEAERVVWSAPGVTTVENHIAVVS